MMNTYRDILPELGGYLTNKAEIHLPRTEAFLQEVGRREPLYFQQRSIDEKDPLYAGDNYRERYYQLKFDLGLEHGDVEATAPPTASDDSSVSLPLPQTIPTATTITTTTTTTVPALAEEYLKGLVWVLSYYHCGCTSWTWSVRPYAYAYTHAHIHTHAHTHTHTRTHIRTLTHSHTHSHTHAHTYTYTHTAHTTHTHTIYIYI